MGRPTWPSSTSGRLQPETSSTSTKVSPYGATLEGRDRRPCTGEVLAPVPEPVRAAIAAVVADMRNVPREIIGDSAEVVHFLGRCARRLDGVRAMRVPVPPPPAPKPPSAVLMASAGADARTAAEASFSTSTRKSPEAAPPPALRVREVRNRRGRAVRIELRRAAGQLDLPL